MIIINEEKILPNMLQNNANINNKVDFAFLYFL